MEKIKIEIEVAKETHELAKALCDFVVTCKTALADGWQLGTDLPAIVTAAVTQLLPGLSGIENLGKEWEEDKPAAVAGLVAGFKDLPKAFEKKEAV